MELETVHSPADSVTNSPCYWANKKCLAICSLVSMANLEFGMDSAIVGNLQAVLGFLMIFGYPEKFIFDGYGLDVRIAPLLTIPAFSSVHN